MAIKLNSGVKLVKTGAWAKAATIFRDAPRAISIALNKAAQEEAELLANRVRKRLENQTELPDPTERTLAKRRLRRIREKRALIERGQLMKAITVRKLHSHNGGEYFIGVPRRNSRKVRGRNITLAQLAQMFEYGATFQYKMTAKQRRAFMAVLREAGEEIDRERLGANQTAPATLTVVNIRKHPFIEPVVKAYGTSRDRERFLRRCEKHGGEAALLFAQGHTTVAKRARKNPR